MNSLNQNQIVPLTWIDISNASPPLPSTITDRFKKDPRHHINNLIGQIAQQEFSRYVTTCNIDKLSNAIKNIPLNSPLVERFYSSLKINNIIDQTQETNYVNQQSKIVLTIDNLIASYSDIVKELERLASISYKDRTDQQSSLIDELTDSSDKMLEDLLYLIRRGDIRNLPLKSPNGTMLFLLLCKHVKPNDNSLYQVIAELIKRSLSITGNFTANDVNIYHQKTDGRTGFDDFLDNGGYLPVLFKMINFGNQDQRETRESYYLGFDDRAISKMNLADVLIGLYFKNVRSFWLNNSESLEFLEGQKLKAFAQIIDYNMPKGFFRGDNTKTYFQQWIPHIKKFELLKQTTFLDYITRYPNIKNLLSEAYIQESGNFTVEKCKIAGNTHLVMSYLKNNEVLLNNISQPQFRALEEIRILNPDNKFTPCKEPDNNNHTPNPHEVFQQISTICQILQTVNLWSPNPTFELALLTLKNIMLRLQGGAPDLKKEKLQELNETLTNGPLETLKYNTLLEVLSPIAIKSNVKVYEDINWDDYVEVFYKNFHKNTTAPSKELLKVYLSQYITPSMNWNDVINAYFTLNPSAALEERPIFPPEKKLKYNHDDNDDDDDDFRFSFNNLQTNNLLTAGNYQDNQKDDDGDFDFNTLLSFLDSPGSLNTPKLMPPDNNNNNNNI